MYFSCNVAFSSLPVFLPTILKDMGFTAINAQGLSAPPYFVSFLITCITPYIADHCGRKFAITLGCCFMVLGGCLTAFCNGYYSALFPSSDTRYRH